MRSLRAFVVVAAIYATVHVLYGILHKVERYRSCRQDHIQEVCKHYEKGNVTGNLCHELCSAKTIDIHTCLTTVMQGTKRVHQATWRGQEIILKFVLDDSHNHLIMDNSDGQKVPFQKIIARKVLNKFGRNDDKCHKCNDIIDLIIKMADVDGNGQLSLVEANTMLKLLDKPESTLLLLLNGTMHGLHFYGYCGQLYATERIPKLVKNIYGAPFSLYDIILPFTAGPLLKELFVVTFGQLYKYELVASVMDSLEHKSILALQYLTLLKSPTLQERFQLAFSFLDTIAGVNSNPFGLLQSCDTHLGNFGLSGNSSIVKYIDLDLTFPRYSVQRMLTRKHCKSDMECTIGNFEECGTSCDLRSGFCTPELASQDLHKLCFRVFSTFNYTYSNFDRNDYSKFLCLTRAMAKVKAYCFDVLPNYETAEELQALVIKVKAKLEDVRDGRYTCHQTGVHNFP